MYHHEKITKKLFDSDFRSESEDEYVKMIAADSKRSFMLRISLGAIYVSLLIISLFIV